MDVARSLRTSSDHLWSAAIQTLGDELSSQLQFDQNDKQKTLGELLVATEKAKESLVDRSWSFHRKNGEVVFVRDLLAKATKWIKHFQAVGDIVVQCDPVHAGLPWASVRFLLTVATGDLDTYKNLLDRTIHITEIICRNALVESLLDDEQPRTEEGLRHELVKLYASILTYLAKVHSYYQKDTLRRIVKQGLLASSDLESAFAAVNEAQAGVDRSIAVFSLQDQLKGRSELKQMLRNFDAPISRWDKVLYTITDQLEGERRRSILRWISDEPYEQYHQQAKSEVLKGTGEWLLHDPQFIHWKNECASSILWLHGILGSGKSKLVSIVIEDTMEAFRNRKAPCPAYFYCSRNPAEPGRSDPGRIVASIARQLSTSHRGGPLLQPTIEVYKHHEDMDFSSGPLRLEQSKKLIFRLLEQYQSATIVIDALDECDKETRRDLLDTLEDLLKESPCLLKIFVSSRTDRDITYKLNNYPNLHLSSDRNTSDIDMFIRSETERLISAGHLCRDSDRMKEMRDKIIDKLTSRAEGMFRLASLQLQNLCQQATDEAIQERLERLPKTLEESYHEILTKIENMDTNADRQYARNALSWLLCAQEQLQSDAFLAMVSTLKNRSTSPISKGQLLQICYNFVILDSTADTFRFAHLSVREFLEDQETFRPASVNALAAEACLLKLLEAPPETSVQTLLLKYSCLFWTEHVRIATQETWIQLHEILCNFLNAEEDDSCFYRWHKSVEELLRDRGVEWDIPRRLMPAISYVPRVLLAVCAFDLCGVVSPERWSQLAQKRPRNKNGETYQEIALRYGRGEILEWQFTNDLSFEVTDEVIKIAASNEENGERVVGLLLDYRMGTDASITKGMIDAASRNQRNGRRIMALLLGREGIGMEITQENVEAIVGNFDQSIFQQLIDRFGSEIQINEGVVTEAVGNRHGKEITAMLLGMSGAEITISDKVFYALAENKDNGKEILALFLDHPSVKVPVTEEALEAIAESGNTDEELWTLLLDNRGTEVSVTEDIIRLVAANCGKGNEFVMWLLDKWAIAIPTTPAVVKAILEHLDETTFQKFLDITDIEILITKDLIHAAAGNLSRGKEVLLLLLERGTTKMEGMEEVVKAIMKESDQANLEYFLIKNGVEVQITEEIVAAAAGNRDLSDKMMALLLERQGGEIPITEQVIDTALNSHNSNSIALLIGKSAATIPMTETVINRIARYMDGFLFRQLLDERGSDIQITGRVIESVANGLKAGKENMALLLNKGNVATDAIEEVVQTILKKCDKTILQIFLDQSGVEIQITERIVQAVAENLADGNGMMDLLLEKQSKAVPVPEGVTKAITGNLCAYIMRRLLDRNGADIQITEDLVEVAAGNSGHGKEVVALLLERQGGKVLITKKIIEAAAGNWGSGREILALLLEKQGGEIPITEEALTAICRRGWDSTETLRLLLEKSRTEVLITEEVVKEAVTNERGGWRLLELLLDRKGRDIQITEGIVEAAAANDKHGGILMALLLEKGGPQIPITEEVIKTVVRNKLVGKDILISLLENGISEIPITEEILEEARQDRRRDDGGDIIGIFSHFVKTEGNTTAWMTGQEEHEELARKQHQTNLLIRLKVFWRHLSVCLILIVLYFIVGNFII